MTSYIGKKVKLFLKNNSTVEGIVSSWTNKEVVIKSSQSEDVLIIYSPKYNIIMAKIYSEEQTIEPVNQKLKPFIKEPELKDILLDKYNPEADLNLRNKNLVELRLAQLQEQKKQIAEHLTSWKLTNTKQDPGYYATPNFAQPSIINNSSKEDKGSLTSDSSRLPRVQRKSGKVR